MCRAPVTNIQVWEWVKSQQGRTRVTDEIKKRKATKTIRVGIIEARIAELKVKAI